MVDIATCKGSAQEDAWEACEGGLLEEHDGGSGENFDVEPQL
jgi:hypothetical protein